MHELPTSEEMQQLRHDIMTMTCRFLDLGGKISWDDAQIEAIQGLLAASRSLAFDADLMLSAASLNGGELRIEGAPVWQA